MLSKWLQHQPRSVPTYKFSVSDITEASALSEELLSFIAKEVVVAHGSPVMIKQECKKLLAHARDLKLNVIKDYIEREVLPAESRPQIRSGNFGEILAAVYLVEFEGFWFPIYKLRYREKKDWSIRLTDLCLIKREGVRRPLLCFGEVKTKAVNCNVNLGVEGHDSLAKDNALEDPEVLRFIGTHLYEMGKLEEADFISDIRLNLREYDRRHDLFIVHNKEHWKEEVLDNLENHDLNKNLINFSVKIVLISELKEVIDNVYARAWKAAEVMVHE